MILWITGISGTGKTTIAKPLYKKFKKKYKSSIYLDGDEIRSVFQNNLKYTLKDRNKNAERFISLVKYLSDQKINLIISANITSNKYRLIARRKLKNFIEIHISAKLKNLIKRDYKNLYKNALKGKINNVVGVDIKYQIPKKVDFIIENNGSKKEFLYNINGILLNLKKIKKKIF